MRVAYSGLIYRKVIEYELKVWMENFLLKILRLSSHSMNNLSSGQITNLISNDASQVEFTFYFLHYLWVRMSSNLNNQNKIHCIF